MGNIIKRIVLTGGPCAGKSTSLEMIEKHLREKGYIVYTIQESATELINSGIKPFGENKIDLIKFQEIILKYQLDKEALIESVAKTNFENRDIIIIYDRGIIDNKAYIGQEVFDKLLNKYNLNEIELLDKYDLVIHLESAAKSSGYTRENNKARNEDKETAIEMDTKTFEAWKYHRNLVRVSCYDSFDEKQEIIKKIIDNNLDKNLKIQNKYLIEKYKYTIDDEILYIKQHYLDIDNIYEYRLRKLTFKRIISYYFTVQKKCNGGVSLIVFDQKIKKCEFEKLMEFNVVKKTISKIRKYVVFDDIKYSVDIFEDGKIILESDNNNCVYENFDIIRDVTGDFNYLNANLECDLKRLIFDKKNTSSEVIN